MSKLPNEEKIIDTLEKILRVLSLQVGADKSTTEKVNLLRLAGIDNKTIAKVLNTTEATVRTLSSRKK
jgi:DNA-binding NarL/FixJ family response regulator